MFAYGVGTVLPMPGQLVLRATAANLESLTRLQDVLQRHLEKFGARRELAVTWGPVENTPDTDDSAEPALAAGSETPARAAKRPSLPTIWTRPRPAATDV